MADAASGKGVIVLTPTATETDVVVARAKMLAIDGLRQFAKATAEEAIAFFLYSKVPWMLKLRSNGWVFFIPGTDLKAYDDVGTPTYIYSPGNRGEYERLNYNRWRVDNLPTPVEEIDPINVPKTAWDHLMEDDD
jgi:hypothetical protein